MEMIAGRRSFGQRMKGAALLDVSTYEEVEHDSTATGQAAGVVAIVAACAAIGSYHGGLAALVGAAVSALVGWLAMAAIVYFIGDKVLGGTATWGEMLRTMGFAQSPGVFYIIGVIPFLGWIAKFFVWIWVLAAVVVGIRQGLDVSTGKALAAGFLAWLALVVVSAVVALIL